MSSKHKQISRRAFLAHGSRAAAGVMAAGTLASCTTAQTTVALKKGVIGANERVNVAVIGVRSRGYRLMRDLAKNPNVRVKTICDIDENLYAERIKEIEQIQGHAPSPVYDLRRVFDDNSIATPNHWHALATIWACQAGKHVYVEKPCSHNIWEGRKMVEAARKYNRIVQAGFNSRSTRAVRQAMKLLNDGIIGEIYMARGLCFKPRGSIGSYPDGPATKDSPLQYVFGSQMPRYTSDYLSKVHYDLWTGPAPKRRFNINRFHYNWHWRWETGNGDIGNQGPHQFDIARWGMNKNEHPVKVSSSGGRFGYIDYGQTPNTQVAVYEYADGKVLQFEVRGLYTNAEKGIKIGNLFYGSKGWMSLDGGTWKTYFGRKNEPGPCSENPGKQYNPADFAVAGGGHSGNFIHAIRSGRKADLACDIEDGHISTVLPLLANISYRLGRALTFDGAAERFVNDKQANRMLKRKYRRPYVVPKKV